MSSAAANVHVDASHLICRTVYKIQAAMYLVSNSVDACVVKFKSKLLPALGRQTIVVKDQIDNDQPVHKVDQWIREQDDKRVAHKN